MVPASFSFATYTGKSDGRIVTWGQFWGNYSLTMNEVMVRLLIDTIDAGSDPDGGLDEDVYDLVDALELLYDKKIEFQSTNEFSCMLFNRCVTIQMTGEGLKVLRDAVSAGSAAIGGEYGPTLTAFIGKTDALILQYLSWLSNQDSKDSGSSDPPVEKRRHKRVERAN